MKDPWCSTGSVLWPFVELVVEINKSRTKDEWNILGHDDETFKEL